MAKDTVVFAAASLKNALDDAIAAYAKAGGGKVVVSYAASSALAKQMENGAAADIFISADLDWMNDVEKHDLIDKATRKNFLGNAIVLIAPTAAKAAKVDIKPGFDLKGLLKDGRLAMADPSAVPAGKYGKEALTKLGAWDSVKDKVASAENVRGALLFVDRGETPVWHRLCHRRRRRQEGRDRRSSSPRTATSRSSIRSPRPRHADADGEEIPRLPRIAGRQARIRKQGFTVLP